MYRKAKRDTNEKPIVDFLRRVGASVVYIDEPGVPDLLVAYRRITFLLEIKSRKGTLTESQKTFIQSWQGSVYVVRTRTEAKHALRSEILRHKYCLSVEDVSKAGVVEEETVPV